MHRKYIRGPLAARFWDRVKKSDGCWEWTGAMFATGYGQIEHNDKTRSTHRVAWELTYGPIPPGMHVCHHCDNRKCVRPDHLFIGTARDNMLDARRKGRLNPSRVGAPRGDLNGSRLHPERVRRGEAVAHARLTAEAVAQIRALHAAGVSSYSQLARRFGVSVGAIANVVQRRTWRHV